MVKRTGGDLLASDVHKTLRNRILTLDIKPRTRLIEEEISAELGVGRTPVREALLRLQGEGLIAKEKGWMVEEGDPSDVHRVFESRIAIEGVATGISAGKIGDEDIARLRDLIERMDDLASITRAELNRMNREFHDIIVRCSDNPFFVEMHERTQYNYWNLRLPVVFNREQVEEANLQHRGILAALEARDTVKAEALARHHIDATLRIVQDTLTGF
jgi:DNA-binding GntR family transcriptional regulator